MPLIAQAVATYVAGLLCGYAGLTYWAAGLGGVASIALLARSRSVAHGALGLVFAVGALVANRDEGRTADHAVVRSPVDSSPLVRWRARAGVSIDSLFGDDAPVVRALLIADTRELPADTRDRFARAGLVHILSISGLHVAIVSGAVLLAFQALRLGPVVARWAAVLVTLLYVAAIGAPPPALRSGAMLAAATASRVFQRPVSPWATLAIGALAPLMVDPHNVLDLGWQLSVAGFAALTAASAWTKRALPRRLRGWRRTLVTDLCVSSLATVASAPLVTWYFARLSLVAPLTNIAAGPIVAVMQPALFLAMVLAPFGAPARIAANGARPLVHALDGIARAGAAIPGGSIAIAPSLVIAALGGAAAVCLLVAAASKRGGWRWLLGAVAGVAAMAWLPALPATPFAPAGMELHMIDVGQGDAIAVRTPRGRWIVVDAGTGTAMGDAGRRVVVPYLRRFGGEVALFVMTHPHDDHVGGAAPLVSLLHPVEVREAAFAGTSTSYRQALVAVRAESVPWRRVRPGDSVDVDGVVATFLAPDSAWTSTLRDPNLSSAVVSVRYGSIRALLTGDAEAPEEAWMVEHAGSHLRADILKVAHHGSATSSTDGFLEAVRPRLALISVGQGNRYHHPSPEVVTSLAAHGARVMRTDESGTIVVRTDREGASFTVESARRAPGR